MRRAHHILIVGGLVVTVVLGTYVLTAPSSTVGAAKLPGRDAEASGPLDGRTYVSEIGLLGEPADLEDTLIFEDGMFVSTECERICNYPASPYYVRREGDAVRFISETRCPHKDATIVWRGTVEDGVIQGVSTWTVDRWYWTIEKKLRFEGRLAEQSS